MTPLTAIERLKEIVIARTGHAYYVDKDRLLVERARERMRAQGISSLEAYVDLLETLDDAEWRALENVITVGETYFFRYPGHFERLRHEILPSLIARRRESRALRIWSIGCSTGPEPYSIAILLREVLGDEVDTWRISLIGGDISEQALSAARSGRYSAWALRTLGAEERARYFDKDGAIWVLKQVYRKMVRFERQNILDLLAPAPPLAWDGFDLIFCRNVLIYFSPAQAVAVINELNRKLASDGSLILGHAEATLSFDPLAAFQVASEFAQALTPQAAPAHTPPDLPPMPALSRAIIARPVAMSQIAQRPSGDMISSEIDNIDRLRGLADAGEYEEAGKLAQQLIFRCPTSAQLQYLDAILHHVSDDLAGAEAALRRALYLDRGFTLAHHRLGLLMLALGRREDARRSLLAAARLAESMAPDALLPEGQGVTAGIFGAQVRAQLSALDEAA